MGVKVSETSDSMKLPKTVCSSRNLKILIERLSSIDKKTTKGGAQGGVDLTLIRHFYKKLCTLKLQIWVDFETDEADFEFDTPASKEVYFST